MSVNALFARVMRVAVAPLLIAIVVLSAPASAQQLSPSGASMNVPAPQAAAPAVIIRHIEVRGTQRIEQATVLSYMSIREGDAHDEQIEDRALKTLYATGLFSGVNFDWDASTATLTVNVVENPIINQIDYEGNSKVTTKDIEKEVQLKPRMVFTRSKVQSDVQRIIEVYRRNGKFGASVDPQIIQRPQNRVDLIFSISEGPTTGVARINFIGNKVYDDSTLAAQIATEKSTWWKILATNDNYDPDRLTFDREQLRRFYLSHGYADFRVVTAIAELSPDHENFYVTFTVDEGDLYKFGKVEIDSDIKELDPLTLRPLVKINPGDTYNAELIQKSIDALTNAAGTKGYAFAEVHPRIRRDHDGHKIEVIFKIDQGPRVYVENIRIVGNQRTLDKVVRREFRLVEGDAFNRVLVDRSRTRIRGLGFFKDVDIKQSPGSQPDRTNLIVNITEQSTGELSLGAGYSSTSSFVGEFSYTERNLFGRGQYVRGSIQISQISKEYQFSFTEPYFLDRPLAAGFDLYKVVTDFQQADYEGDTSAAAFHVAFPTSEYGTMGLRYAYKIDKVLPFSGAPEQVLLASGNSKTSAFGVTFSYSTLDDNIKPTRGVAFSISQDFAGLGGTLQYLRTTADFATYKKVMWDQFVGSFQASSGYITGYGGQVIPINERFFKGGDSFRGFKLAGIGPRDTLIQGEGGAVGGDFFAIGTLSLRIPNFLPEDYGINMSLFSDFGTLGKIDSTQPLCAVVPPATTLQACIKDNLALRASAGISVGWKSPFGPLQIDLGVPFLKTKYDQTEIIHFSAGTGF